MICCRTSSRKFLSSKLSWGNAEAKDSSAMKTTAAEYQLSFWHSYKPLWEHLSSLLCLRPLFMLNSESDLASTHLSDNLLAFYANCMRLHAKVNFSPSCCNRILNTWCCPLATLGHNITSMQVLQLMTSVTNFPSNCYTCSLIPRPSSWRKKKVGWYIVECFLDSCKLSIPVFT